MPRTDAIAELAQKLLMMLEQQRQSGGEYPLLVCASCRYGGTASFGRPSEEGACQKAFCREVDFSK